LLVVLIVSSEAEAMSRTTLPPFARTAVRQSSCAAAGAALIVAGSSAVP
jgi:hypothetical protein